MGVVRGLVFDAFIILVGFATFYSPVHVVESRKPVSFAVLEIYFLFLLSVLVPRSPKPVSQFAVLPDSFRLLLFVLIPFCPSTVRLALLEVHFRRLLPVLVPFCPQSVRFAFLIGHFRPDQTVLVERGITGVGIISTEKIGDPVSII